MRGIPSHLYHTYALFVPEKQITRSTMKSKASLPFVQDFANWRTIAMRFPANPCIYNDLRLEPGLPLSRPGLQGGIVKQA
jgi:hypothetical protein